jgi:hypothetical protein
MEGRMNPKVLTFDHQKLVDRDPREVRRVRAWLKSAENGNCIEVVTLHEADNSCCAREPWNDTISAIWTASGPRRSLVMVNLLSGDHPEHARRN